MGVGKKNINNILSEIDQSNHSWETKSFAFPDRTIRLGTSFSGIGAIEQALIQLGLNVEIMFAGDIDGNCKNAYFANYNIDPIKWHTDVHDFDARPYKGKIDLFVGGAPCQAFSMRGKRKGFEDTRGTLFREFARILMECQPKVFIFENVRGILNHDGGNTWDVIKNTFEKDCGYRIYYRTLNGKDYGVAQSRERLFCVGFKDDIEFTFPAPIELKHSIYDYLEKEISSKYFLKEKGINFITRELNYSKCFTQINGDIALCQKRNQQFNWHGDFVYHPLTNHDNENDLTLRDTSECETQYYINSETYKYALSPISDSKFIMEEAKEGPFNNGIFRKLTPRECLRLMGFNDSFKIVVSDTETYKQAGNSIIVDVLKAIIKQLDITRFAE